MVKQLSMPFNHTLSSNIGTCTTQTKRYGHPGDSFRVNDRVFVITEVQQIALSDVATYHYKEAGFNTPTDFVLDWQKSHRRNGWQPEQKVWVHFFV